VKQSVLIGQVLQRSQDHPQGASQREEFIAAPYHPFEPPMPTSWIPPYADFSSHPSWDWYDSRAQLPSYFRPYYVEYAAPRKPTLEGQSKVKSRFYQKNWFGAREEKKTVIKQVYRVKKDGREDASSDLISNDKKPIKVLETSAIDGKVVRQASDDCQIPKSEQRRLEVPKIKKELPLLK